MLILVKGNLRLTGHPVVGLRVLKAFCPVQMDCTDPSEASPAVIEEAERGAAVASVQPAYALAVVVVLLIAAKARAQKTPEAGLAEVADHLGRNLAESQHRVQASIAVATEVVTKTLMFFVGHCDFPQGSQDLAHV